MNILKKIEKATITPVKRAIRRMRHASFSTALNKPTSYEAYVATQTEGNHRKLGNVAVVERNVYHMARYWVSSRGDDPRNVLCHGTRNGAEIGWFKTAFPKADVLGTEISDTATQFPNTIQWDFHEMKEEWRGAWDLIYSNSWDHAFDPDKAFRNWMACLSPKGLILLEHCAFHTPAHVTQLDVFGETLPALRARLDRVGAPDWKVVDVIEDLPIREANLRVIVVGRGA